MLIKRVREIKSAFKAPRKVHNVVFLLYIPYITNLCM